MYCCILPVPPYVSVLAERQDCHREPAERSDGESRQDCSGAGSGSGRPWVCISGPHLRRCEEAAAGRKYIGEIQTWSGVEISQPQVTLPSRASLYVEDLEVSDSEVVGEETVPGAGEHLVVPSLPPGLSPQVGTVW